MAMKANNNTEYQTLMRLSLLKALPRVIKSVHDLRKALQSIASGDFYLWSKYSEHCRSLEIRNDRIGWCVFFRDYCLIISNPDHLREIETRRQERLREYYQH